MRSSNTPSQRRSSTRLRVYATRSSTILWLLLAVVVGGPAGADEAEDASLRAELLQGKGDGDWRGVLENRVMKKDASQVGSILGPLFSDPALYEKNAACVAYTAAWLADHPVNAGKDVLLSAFVLLRAYRDEGFLVRLDGHLTKYGGGHERLIDHAKRALAGGSTESLEVRRAAVWFLSQEREPSARLDSIRFLHARALEGLGVPGGSGGASDPLSLEVLDAFRRLLDRRLSSLPEAVEFLSRHPGASLVDLLDARIQDPTEGEEADRARAVEYGTSLIASAQRPEDLVPFLDANRTPYSELRQAAMKRAQQLGPKADDGWQRLLCLVLERGEDPEVVRGAVQALEKVASDFRKSGERAEPIARCVVGRLQRLGPDSLWEDRARMAAILGRLGIASALLDAVTNERSSPRPVEARVLAELISATGEVEGVPVEAILQHVREHRGDDPADRAIRRAVANALGLAGIASTQGEAASAALRAFLTGEGVEGIERETAPEVRELAIQRLQSYPGPATASVLGRIAEGRDDEEAEKALLVLGGHAGQGDADATRMLAGIASGSAAEDRRRRTIADLGSLGANASPETLALAQEAVRSVLASTSAPLALRAEAAAAAARLGDADSIAAAVAWWKEDPAPRGRVVVDLVTAVAARGPAHDAAIQAALLDVATAGGADLASDAAKALEEATPRFTLRVARGMVLLARARSGAREPKDRRKDLEQADATLATAATSEVPTEKEEAILVRLEVLKDLAAVQESGPERTALLLRVIEDASALQSRAVAQRTGGIEEILARETLDESQTARFRKARERLEILRRAG